MVVLLQLLPLSGLGPLSLALLDICLKLSNLLIDVGDVLFDDIGEFLGGSLSLGERDGENPWKLTLISTGLSSKRVFRFATVGW